MNHKIEITIQPFCVRCNYLLMLNVAECAHCGLVRIVSAEGLAEKDEVL